MRGALFVLARASRARLRNRWYEVKEQQSSAMSVVQEALAAVRVVKAFGMEEFELGRFRDATRRHLRVKQSRQRRPYGRRHAR